MQENKPAYSKSTETKMQALEAGWNPWHGCHKLSAGCMNCYVYRIDAQHGRGLAICRIIPVLRTIVSIPAGLIRMPVKWFVGWSALGIAAWNTVLISFGYFFSEKILAMW